MNKAYLSFLFAVCLLSVFGGAVYRLYQLNYASIFLTLILTVITFILLKKWNNSKNEPQNAQLITHNAWRTIISNIQYPNIIIFLTCFLTIINFYILFNSTTVNSVISPWQTVPWYFWLTFIASTILLIAIALKNLSSHFLYFLLFTFYFLLSFSVALIIYQVGFGFDPFIHQATEKLIDAAGAVYPKPWYYLGQYALIVILHKVTFIPIIWLDKLLVPVLAALTLPYALYQAAKSFTADERVAKLTALFALIFPFATFTLTTPQNLANLFLILIILLSLNKKIQDSTSYFLLLTLSFAALLTHPIAGIPAVLFVTLIIVHQHVNNKKLFFTSYFLLLTLAAVSLPLAFYLNNQTSSVINAASDTAAKISWHLPQLFFSGQENFLLNFIYFYGFNIGIIITTFIIVGIILNTKQEKKITRYPLPVTRYSRYLLMSISLLISYLLTKTISFSYLINYERSNFADRILIIAVYFSLPFILIALTKLIQAILKQEHAVRYLLFCLLVFLLSCSLYFSYPRFDDYFNSRSFSTSQADVDAVRWIENDAPDDNFIVLANQQVSAAALREFGFKKYYPGDEGGEIFYYPIPTGEKLYQYYLDMVDKNANKKTALVAADLVGANTTYFVINNYWFGFEKILAEARIGADAVQSIDNGKIYIFKYRK